MSHLTHLRNAAPLLPDAQWLFLKVNPATFTDPGDAARLAAATRESGLAPECLVIEVQESGGTDVAEIARATHAFRAQGFLVAVDDFGAGHSNIDRLLTLKPDIVKLDRSLVRAGSTHRAPLRDALMPKLVDLLHESGMFVVAEGIETCEDLMLAARSNVDFVQGYLFGMPSAHLVARGAAMPLFEDVFDALAQMRRIERLAGDLLLLPYRSGLMQAAARFAGGATTEAACADLLALPCTLNCFFFDQGGREFMPVLAGAAAKAPSERFAPIADPSAGRWDNRPYFVDAHANPQQVIASAPYLSVTGTSLCVTLTIAIQRAARPVVVGADLDWRRLIEAAPAIF
ncbi:EAL domain [Candidatus Paraburkholderia kirkii]|nr:EAL domain [Candidatus Paraburkholderia kirkii]